MKLIIRAFVVVLALTGAVASTQTSSAASAKTIAASTNLGALPVPTCPPDGSSNNCNIQAGQIGK
jgi:hypothetical protein